MKNKILAISIIFILISFTFINSCFAYTVSCDSADFYIADGAFEKLQTFDEYKSGNYYYYVYHLYNNYYTIFIEKSQLDGIYFYKKSSNYIVSSKPVPNSTCYIVLDNNYSTYNKETLTNFTFNNKVDSSNDGAYMCLTNFDIYSDINKSSLFFPYPPVVEITLAGIMKTAGEQATLEVGQIILKVIATTAGLMVLLIGLKKGLKVLMNVFRH